MSFMNEIHFKHAPECRCGMCPQSKAGYIPSFWVPCPGCPSSERYKCNAALQCGKNLKWRQPITVNDHHEYAEQLSCSIFYHRRELKRHQAALDAVEPVFSRLVDRLIEIEEQPQ